MHKFSKICSMRLEIINSSLTLNICGFSGIARNKDYSATAFKLMNRMWKTVKSKKLENKGLNIWVYEEDYRVFAGLELSDMLNQDTGLEQKSIILLKYAYYKHVGPYSLIKREAQNMKDELKRKGYENILPYIEIYGHWTNDETKLETELLMCLKWYEAFNQLKLTSVLSKWAWQTKFQHIAKQGIGFWLNKLCSAFVIKFSTLIQSSAAREGRNSTTQPASTPLRWWRFQKTRDFKMHLQAFKTKQCYLFTLRFHWYLRFLLSCKVH